MGKFDRRDTALIASNPYWDYKLDHYELPTGAAGEYHYVETPGSVLVVPVLDDGRLVMARQYRYLNQQFSIEFPGGGIKRQGNPGEAAGNELAEECGYAAGELKEIGRFNPFNGVTSEICHVFLATGLVRHFMKHDESEEFDVINLRPGELNDKIAAGEIWDGMTLAAWCIFKNNNK